MKLRTQTSTIILFEMKILRQSMSVVNRYHNEMIKSESLKIFYEKFEIRFKFFLKQVNISGIRFLLNSTTIGKIFWIVGLMINFAGMLIIFQLTSERFYSDVVNIGVDTNYLNWNSTFPAVSVCFLKGRSSTSLNSLLQAVNLSNQVSFSRVIHGYMFTNPNTLPTSIYSMCKKYNSTCGVDFEFLVNKFLPKDCNTFMADVYFAGKAYRNCSELFKFHKTEIGYCFTANNIVSYDYKFTNLPLKFNRESTNFELHFLVKITPFYNYNLYIHSPENFPHADQTTRPLTSKSIRISLNIEEIINENGVGDQPYERRGCRFTNEKIVNSTFHYSFSTCLADIRVDVMLEACNCTTIWSPGKYRQKFCDMKGLVCLSNNNINERAKKLAIKNCLPSCEEQRITVIGENDEIAADRPGFTLTAIEIINLPTVRFVRTVARTPLDLVVTIGGVAGLFFGASIMNIGEAFYIFLIRKF